jgi:hypothetical protein
VVSRESSEADRMVGRVGFGRTVTQIAVARRMIIQYRIKLLSETFNFLLF